MCSRPCLRKPVRYKKGEPIFRLPPVISGCCLLLPTAPLPICADSESRVRKDVRVRPPPPAPPPFPLRGAQREGVERARIAERVAEEKRDARERGSPEPRRKGRSPGWAAPLPDELRSLGYPATNSPRGKAQAGESLGEYFRPCGLSSRIIRLLFPVARCTAAPESRSPDPVAG